MFVDLPKANIGGNGQLEIRCFCNELMVWGHNRQQCIISGIISQRITDVEIDIVFSCNSYRRYR